MTGVGDTPRTFDEFLRHTNKRLVALERQIVRRSGVTVSDGGGGGGGSGAPVDWSQITGKPSTFPPDPHAHASTEITDFATAVPAAVPAATETVPGKIEIATQAEVTAGTDDARAITALKLAQRIAAIPPVADASETVKGIVELATAAETQTGTDTVRAVHPAGLKSVTDILYNKVTGRGNDLVTNGSAYLLNNYNFSTFTFVPGDQPTGAFGSFWTGVDAQTSGSRFTDEIIPIDTSRAYKGGVWARQARVGTTSNIYYGLAPYDADALSIQPVHYMEQANTRTTLAADLVAGQTTMQLASAANWNNAAGGNGYLRNVIFWNYVDGKGKAWPAGTYSRNVKTDAYADGGISGNTVTLRTAHTGATIPAGTPVSNGSSGGNYMYATGIANAALPSTGAWTQYVQTPGFYFTGVHTNNAVAASTAFPIATAGAKVVLLFGTAASAASKNYFANVSLTDVIYPPPAATETMAGIVELATAAETTTGTDNTRAVHPAGLKVELDKKAALAHTHTASQITDFATAVPAAVPAASETAQGKIEIATATEVSTGADATRAVTPATLMPLIAGGANVPVATTVAAGKIELATAAEVTAGTDATLAVTPATLKVELDKKAPLTSPALTGTPTAPTAAPGTNTTQIATTAFATAADALLIPKSLVDAKGDLIAATADNVPARLAVGTDGQQLVADSTQPTGLRWSTPAGGGVGDATTTTKGVIKLAGDLAGTADLPTVPGLALQIPRALVDAKGDLIVATADDTPARLAVGADGQVLIADSTQAAGMKWAPGASTPLPAPLRPTFTNSTNPITTATAWGAGIPGMNASMTVTEPLWVLITAGAWMELGAGTELRAGVDLTGATVLAPQQGQSGSGNWGQTLLQLGGDFVGLSQRTMQKLVLLNPGTTTFTMRAYRPVGTGTASLNYPVMEVTPVGWADAPGLALATLPVQGFVMVTGLSQVLPAAATPPNFGAASYADGITWDAANDQFVVETAGWYEMQGNVLITPGATGVGIVFYGALHVNNVLLTESIIRVWPTANLAVGINVMTQRQLAVGDTIKLVASRGSAATANALTDASFMVRRVRA